MARVLGWLILAFGTFFAGGTFAACSAIVGEGALAPYILSLPIVVATAVLSFFLFKGSRALVQSGDSAQKASRIQATFALANTRAGRVTPAALAESIGITPDDADAFLTGMAKENPEQVSIEVDDNGTLYYAFSAALWQAVGARSATGVAVVGRSTAASRGPRVAELMPLTDPLPRYNREESEPLHAAIDPRDDDAGASETHRQKTR